ncbi:MAG: hypothetical protein ACXVEF_06375 [Polyangiales bacterium]
MIARALLALAVIVAGCSESSPPDTGRDQPLRVTTARAQFFPGALPHGDTGPKIVTLDSLDNRVRPGFVAKAFSGNAAKGTYSVGIHFADLGSGYWTVPVEDLDPITDGEVKWSVALDVAPDVPLGKHPFELVAFDGDGNAGPLYTQDFEITAAPLSTGHVVISLQWNSSADLDLVVFTPALKRVDPKHPTTALADAGVDAADPSIGAIDRDSNGSCVQDGYDEESLVFAGSPPPGLYQIGAEMVSGCGATAATYTITVTVDGKQIAQQAGRFIEAYDATGGGKPVNPILKVQL